MTQIRRSMLVQVGDHEDGKVLVSISVVASVGEHSRARVVSAASYDDPQAAWRAVRDFATQRLLEGAEEQVTRPSPAALAPTQGSPESPF